MSLLLRRSSSVKHNVFPLPVPMSRTTSRPHSIAISLSCLKLPSKWPLPKDFKCSMIYLREGKNRPRGLGIAWLFEFKYFKNIGYKIQTSRCVWFWANAATLFGIQIPPLWSRSVKVDHWILGRHRMDREMYDSAQRGILNAFWIIYEVVCETFAVSSMIFLPIWRFFDLIVQLQCFLLVDSSVHREYMSRRLRTYQYWRVRCVNFLFGPLVGVWKASVFDHDEVHPDSLVCYSGYCLRISLPIYPS